MQIADRPFTAIAIAAILGGALIFGIGLAI